MLTNSTDTLFAIDVNAARPEERPSVQPVVGVFMSTIVVNALMQAASARDSLSGSKAPSVLLGIDTLPYDSYVDSQVGQGFDADLVRRDIPNSHYFQIPPCFSSDMDFDSPLNTRYQHYIHTGQLRELARTQDEMGGRGTPALVAAQTFMALPGLVEFFRRHFSALRSLAPANLQLRAGTRVYLITTYCGGTGVGGSLLVGVALRRALGPGDHSVQLLPAMPCLLPDNEPRRRANAYAQLMELRHYHSEG